MSEEVSKKCHVSRGLHDVCNKEHQTVYNHIINITQKIGGGRQLRAILIAQTKSTIRETTQNSM